MALTPMNPFSVVAKTYVLPDSNVVTELDPQPFSNSNEIVFVNLSDQATFLIKQVRLFGSPPVLPIPVTVDKTTSIVLPPGAAETICLGQEGQRMPCGTVAFWTANAGSRFCFVVRPFNSVEGAELNVQLIQKQGGAPQAG